jgi:hypothetical protein
MSDNNLVSFRLSSELRELIEEQAEADGVTFSAKVREYCAGGVDEPRKNQRLVETSSAED